jgi:hypothetical protein
MQLVTVTTRRSAVRTIEQDQLVIHRRGRAQVRTIEPKYSLAGDIQLFKNTTRRTCQNMLEALHMAFGGRTPAG